MRIRTRYVAATDTGAGKIRAMVGPKRIHTSIDHSLELEERHRQAAVKIAHKIYGHMNFDLELVDSTSTGFVYAATPRTGPMRLTPTH